MASRDPRIDAYIANAAQFARPILEHLRTVVHAACPEVEEGLKWSMPFFGYRGAPMCAMAAFKQHCSFSFWLYEQVVGAGAQDGDGKGMGQFGKLAAVQDLPPEKELVAYLKKAMALNEAGAKRKRPAVAPKPPPSVPEDLAALLGQRKHAAARKAWQGFSPAMQREYVEWIAEAKTDATRRKRIATTLEWLAEGKQRNWKYQSC